MTNLTKERREAIFQSVLKGTFIIDEREAILKSTREAVREALRRALPAGFEAATANLPPEWFDSEHRQYLYADHSPALILQPLGWDGKVTSSGYFSFDPLRVPASWQPAIRRGGHGAPSWSDVLAAQIDAATKLKSKEDALRTELMGFLWSVKTYKQVIEKMPDLERHLPDAPGKSYPLAVSTAPLVAVLGKLGFDRSAT